MIVYLFWHPNMNFEQDVLIPRSKTLAGSAHLFSYRWALGGPVVCVYMGCCCVGIRSLAYGVTADSTSVVTVLSVRTAISPFGDRKRVGALSAPFSQRERTSRMVSRLSAFASKRTNPRDRHSSQSAPFTCDEEFCQSEEVLHGEQERRLQDSSSDG